MLVMGFSLRRVGCLGYGERLDALSENGDRNLSFRVRSG